jgi:hypothetical protein
MIGSYVLVPLYGLPSLNPLREEMLTVCGTICVSRAMRMSLSAVYCHCSPKHEDSEELLPGRDCSPYAGGIWYPDRGAALWNWNSISVSGVFGCGTPSADTDDHSGACIVFERSQTLGLVFDSHHLLGSLIVGIPILGRTFPLW